MSFVVVCGKMGQEDVGEEHVNCLVKLLANAVPFVF